MLSLPWEVVYTALKIKHGHLCPAFNMQAFVLKDENCITFGFPAWLFWLLTPARPRSVTPHLLLKWTWQLTLFYFPTAVSTPVNTEKVGNNWNTVLSSIQACSTACFTHEAKLKSHLRIISGCKPCKWWSNENESLLGSFNAVICEDQDLFRTFSILNMVFGAGVLGNINRSSYCTDGLGHIPENSE